MSKPKPTPCNMCMANQTIIKPLGLIKDLKIIVHGNPYVVTFIVIHSIVLDSNYFLLLGHPWLKDVKVFHNWGNNTITIQGVGTILTIHVTKKLGTPTKCPKVLVCYDFHFRISNKEEDLMFATNSGVFSIGTIVVCTSIWSNQHVKLITLTCLNLVEHVIKHVELMFKPHVSSNIPIKPIYVQHVKIVIPFNTFQQHLPKTFFQLEVGKMEIDKTIA